MTPSRVRKRDGREAPFDVRKIEAAVAKALAAVGEQDAGFARELASVVELTLDNRYPARGGAGAAHVAPSTLADNPGRDSGAAAEAAPDIEEIQDLVEQGLIELGRANVAKAYILYRDRRARAREALAVHTSSSQGAASARQRVEVQTPERTLAWSKGRITAALINEAQLPRETAERVAAAVEERVFAAGLKRISTALVRELVDNELVTLGLAAALRRQVAYGLPAYDLRALLAEPLAQLDPARPISGEALAERRADARLSAEVLRRFAPDEVLSAAGAAAHLAGDLHVANLSAPHLPLTLGVPLELIASAQPSAGGAFELLNELVELAHGSAAGIVLEQCGPWIAALAAGPRSSNPGGAASPSSGWSALGAWLRALAAASNAAGRRIDLALSDLGARGPALLERLIEELVDPALGPCGARLFLAREDLHALVEHARRDERFAGRLERAFALGRITPTWGDDTWSCVGPGLFRGRGERGAIACGGAVALNLPRLALRAGPWREDRALELLSASVHSAVRVLDELSQFHQRAGGARHGALRARAHFVIAPVGLREMLAYLGDGELRPDQGARVLGLIADAARRYAAPLRLSIDLDPHFGERAAARFARLDAELPQHAQRLLFGDGVGAGVDPLAPYSEGWRLSPAPGRAAWEAEAIALSTLGAGALQPLPLDPARRASVASAEAWARFDRLLAHRDDDLDDELGGQLGGARSAAAEGGAGLFSSLPSLDATQRAEPSAGRRPQRTSRGA